MSTKSPRASARLAVLGQSPPPKERADAAENRRKILSAARRLLKKRAMGDICMDAVAAEAGVGKGTLYRRFPDRTALCFALPDESARALQDEIIAGASLPPSPRARVLGFLEALFEFVFDNALLLSEAWAAHKGGPERYEHPGHAWQRQALIGFLRVAVEAGEIEDVDDLTITAELLIAGLNPDLVRWLYAQSGDREQVKGGFLDAWRRQLGG